MFQLAGNPAHHPSLAGTMSELWLGKPSESQQAKDAAPHSSRQRERLGRLARRRAIVVSEPGGKAHVEVGQVSQPACQRVPAGEHSAAT